MSHLAATFIATNKVPAAHVFGDEIALIAR